ncbi:VOC family protein [Radiobacillus kanasensis]|uniref:VOC family protein n=1 Tax=Radiobacillus kanasensis TaxID=2844358 RepID=UPI001E5EAB41|nr:VOC family protein [Radiobacillus kanasensis]UFU00059.1 VOC family protein [Radiobacillus kanasensis]
MSELFKRIDTVFLKVKHFDEAVEWYEKILGFEVRWKIDEGGIAAMEIGETPLTLMRATEGFRPVEEPQFNFYVSNIHKAYNHLKSHGIEVMEIIDHGDLETFDFKDLDGNVLSVCCFEE